MICYLNKKEVIIFGAGSTLEKTIQKYKNMIEGKVKITADGATTALLERNVHPDLVVTDLDGKIQDQLKASNLGCKTIIHTHGDNTGKIIRHVPEFKKGLFGTTQINPQPYCYLHNYGGFTDGDRAVFLADHFQAKKIYLAGFDFDGKIGKYSFATNKDKEFKLKKLKWCEYLINILEKENQNIHYLKV
jgi:2-amino-4-hydroxy-6-hydroxymethyldihydropteridine diphosphokinase